MNKIIPFFDLNGKHYEIKKTRYLLAEYDKMSENNNVSNEDKENATKVLMLTGDVQKYASKVDELEQKYFETFDEEDEKKYKKAKELYEQAFDRLNKFEVETGCTKRVQKASIDLLEQLAIKGLAEQYFDMDTEQASKVWCEYVDTLASKTIVVEWLTSFAECILSNEDEKDDNSFLAQMRKKAEKKQAEFRKVTK